MKKLFLLIPFLGIALNMLVVAGCKKEEDKLPPVVDTYAGTYVGIESIIQFNGSLGNPKTNETRTPKTIEVNVWDTKIIIEGDTLQLDSLGHYRDNSHLPEYFEIRIEHDSLLTTDYSSTPPTWKLFSGKRK